MENEGDKQMANSLDFIGTGMRETEAKKKSNAVGAESEEKGRVGGTLLNAYPEPSANSPANRVAPSPIAGPCYTGASISCPHCSLALAVPPSVRLGTRPLRLLWALRRHAPFIPEGFSGSRTVLLA